MQVECRELKSSFVSCLSKCYQDLSPAIYLLLFVPCFSLFLFLSFSIFMLTIGLNRKHYVNTFTIEKHSLGMKEKQGKHHQTKLIPPSPPSPSLKLAHQTIFQEVRTIRKGDKHTLPLFYPLPFSLSHSLPLFISLSFLFHLLALLKSGARDPNPHYNASQS